MQPLQEKLKKQVPSTTSKDTYRIFKMILLDNVSHTQKTQALKTKQ